ncbi:hypothetical protein gpAD87_10235 [Paenibacillus sp. AD87]|nr:hypothetical protein gpAD87_10235 [Paenibacillus sp. AD87]
MTDVIVSEARKSCGKAVVVIGRTAGEDQDNAGRGQEYQLQVELMSPDNNWAQSACNVMMNGELMLTVLTSGTEGRWVRQKFKRISLEQGLYELKLNHVKPGMSINWIEFKPC